MVLAFSVFSFLFNASARRVKADGGLTFANRDEVRE